MQEGVKMPENIPKRLLSVKEASFYLGISRALLYQWIAAGNVPIIKLRTRTLVDREELDLIIEKLKKAQRS